MSASPLRRLLWLTDLHLDHASPSARADLVAEIQSQRVDAILVGGDIADGRRWPGELKMLADTVDAPVYFVLGNHDFYRWSIRAGRGTAQQLHDIHPRLTWLPAAEVVSLSDNTALIGHGGWGDGRAGSFAESNVLLNDYLLIEELAAVNFPSGVPHFPVSAPELILTTMLQRALAALGAETAAHFRRTLPVALEWAEHVVVLTHVPPFREACWYQGRTSDDNWAPHFTCIAGGEVLREMMRQFPHRRMTVFCGHTHGAGHVQILPNLEVKTGGAEYGQPRVQQIIDV